MGERRQLSYADWDAVLADLKQLSEGYAQHGKWDLEQAAKHLNDWLRYPMDGFPRVPLPIAYLMAAIRVTAGPALRSKIIAEGKMKDGVPTAPHTVYKSSSDVAAAQAAVAQLQATIARFREHAGPLQRSPIFGDMDKVTAEKLQLVHFAHHLSWLSPRAV